jgi:predicted methyltransferase
MTIYISFENIEDNKIVIYDLTNKFNYYPNFQYYYIEEIDK